MDYQDLVKPSVLTQPVYEPGKPIEYVAREYGLDPQGILKLASNENPIGASPRALEAAGKALSEVHLYPDGGGVALRNKLAQRYDLEPDQFLLGNGSNEIMELLGHAFIQPGDEVVFGAQAFIVYHLITLLFDGKPVAVPMPDGAHDLEAMRAAVTDRTRLMFLPSPNNPTGAVVDADALKALIRSLPQHVIFCFDEAYAEYLEDPVDLRGLIAEGHKVICTRTFSKIYGLAGMRVGYAYANAELIRLLQRVRQPFHVNSIALAAAEAALDDHDFVLQSREMNRKGRLQLLEGLRALNMKVGEAGGNFILLEVGNAQQVFEWLQQRSVITRPLTGYGLPGTLRITIGTESQNEQLLDVMARLCGAI